MKLDLPTLSVLLVVSFVVQSLALWVQYASHRSVRGTLWWALGSSLIALRYALNSLQAIPALSSLAVMASNLIFLYGLACLYIGVRHFFGRNLLGWFLPAGSVILTLVYIFFTWLIPSRETRIIVFSFCMAAVSLAISFAFVQGDGKRRNGPLTLIPAFMFGLQGLYWLFRAILECRVTEGASALSNTSLDLAIVSYLVTLLSSNIWTYSFITMVGKRLADQNLEEKEYLAHVFELTPEALITTRYTDGTFLACNDRFTSLTGYSRNEILLRSSSTDLFWSNPLAREAFLSQLKVSGVVQDHTARFKRKNGSIFYANLSSRILQYRGEDIILSIVRDVTKWVETEQDLKKLTHSLELQKSKAEQSANTDALTGLANRRVFDETLEREIARARRDGTEIGLIMLDVDFFKKYNDELGHQQGDECLKAIARILAKSVKRAADLPVRYGGEEFAVIVPSTDTPGLFALAEGIRIAIEGLALPHPAGVGSVVTVSLGLASVPATGLSGATILVQCADGALYEAKHQGRNRVAIASELRLAFSLRPESVCLVFGEKYCCGHPTIDAQHRSLTILMNEILKAHRGEASERPLQDLVASLLDEVARHFHSEEAVLRSAGWHELERHSRIHWELERALGSVYSSWRAGYTDERRLVSFIIHDIVVNHLIEEDCRFFPYMRERAFKG